MRHLNALVRVRARRLWDSRCCPKARRRAPRRPRAC